MRRRTPLRPEAATCATATASTKVELLVESSDGQVLRIEVELAAHVTDASVRHSRWLGAGDVVDLLVSKPVPPPPPWRGITGKPLTPLGA